VNDGDVSNCIYKRKSKSKSKSKIKSYMASTVSSRLKGRGLKTKKQKRRIPKSI